MICPPFGREAPRAHPLVRRVAEVVSGRGFGVLRFDYSGTGDSAGGSKTATLDRWITDVEVAKDEAMRDMGTGRVCVVGIRFGGLLAAHVGAHRGAFDTLVLVDPVADGGTQIENMRRLERSGWAELERPTRTLEAEQARGLMGIPFGPALLEAVTGLSLSALGSRPARRVGLFVGEVDEPGTWAAVQGWGGDVERRSIETTLDSGFHEGIWLPGGLPGALADWLEEGEA